jgi:hypothetical protein
VAGQLFLIASFATPKGLCLAGSGCGLAFLLVAHSPTFALKAGTTGAVLGEFEMALTLSGD